MTRKVILTIAPTGGMASKVANSGMIHGGKNGGRSERIVDERVAPKREGRGMTHPLASYPRGWATAQETPRIAAAPAGHALLHFSRFRR